MPHCSDNPLHQCRNPKSTNGQAQGRGLPTSGLLALTLAACLLTVAVQAAPPSAASLLPGTTKGYVSTTDLAAFSAAWDQTQFGQLMLAPEMQPFADDLKGQLRDKWAQSFLKLGVTWEDVQKIAGGECCTAIVWEKDNKIYPHKLPASVFLVDVTGKEKQAEELLARVAKDMLQQNAKRSEGTAAGAKISVFDAPAEKRKKNNTGRYVFFLKDKLLCACDVYEVAAAIADRLSGKAASSLEQADGFKAVMNRCEADARSSQAQPQARWFVVPIDFMEARRLMREGPRPQRKKSDPLDNLEVMRHQGFAEIKGAGAYVQFNQQPYDIYQRVAVYAPQPLKLAARILDFPNDEPAAPEKWVPTDIATCGYSHWNVPEAFEASKTLFDEFYGIDPTELPTKGKKKKKTSYFEDAINGFKSDPNGPKVDLRADLMKYLGPKTYFITDYEKPITPTSELRLFATEIRDVKKVALAIEKLMNNDPAIERIPKKGTFGEGKHVIWRIPEDEPADDVPSLKVENVPDETKAEDQKSEKPLPGQEGGRLLANSYITVAHGYLMVASSLDLVKKALRDPGQRQPLGDDLAYQQVEKSCATECSRRGWKSICYRRFSRTDEEFESTYELTRQGKMPESEAMLGQFLSSRRSDEKGSREQRIDGSKMPPYEQVRGYFAPNGWVGRTETKGDGFEGWFLVNFIQRKPGGVARAR